MTTQPPQPANTQADDPLAFRDRVIKAIVDNENDERNREFYGVSMEPERGGDVYFWYARNEINAVVVVSEEGFTQEAVDRALAAVKLSECGDESLDYFLTAIVAIPGDYATMDTPVLDGYEVWDEFGLHWFAAYAVAPAAVDDADAGTGKAT